MRTISYAKCSKRGGKGIHRWERMPSMPRSAGYRKVAFQINKDGTWNVIGFILFTAIPASRRQVPTDVRHHDIWIVLVSCKPSNRDY